MSEKFRENMATYSDGNRKKILAKVFYQDCDQISPIIVTISLHVRISVSQGRSGHGRPKMGYSNKVQLPRDNLPFYKSRNNCINIRFCLVHQFAVLILHRYSWFFWRTISKTETSFCSQLEGTMIQRHFNKYWFLKCWKYFRKTCLHMVTKQEKKFFYQEFSIKISNKFLLLFCKFLFTCAFTFHRTAVDMEDLLWITSNKNTITQKTNYLQTIETNRRMWL